MHFLDNTNDMSTASFNITTTTTTMITNNDNTTVRLNSNERTAMRTPNVNDGHQHQRDREKGEREKREDYFKRTRQTNQRTDSLTSSTNEQYNCSNIDNSMANSYFSSTSSLGRPNRFSSTRRTRYLDDSDEEIIEDEILEIIPFDHYPTLDERWGDDAKTIVKRQGDLKVEDYVEFEETEPTKFEEIIYEITYQGDQIRSTREIYRTRSESRNFRKLKKRRIKRKRTTPLLPTYFTTLPQHDDSFITSRNDEILPSMIHGAQSTNNDRSSQTFQSNDQREHFSTAAVDENESEVPEEWTVSTDHQSSETTVVHDTLPTTFYHDLSSNTTDAVSQKTSDEESSNYLTIEFDKQPETIFIPITTIPLEEEEEEELCQQTYANENQPITSDSVDRGVENISPDEQQSPSISPETGDEHAVLPSDSLVDIVRQIRTIAATIHLPSADLTEPMELTNSSKSNELETIPEISSSSLVSIESSTPSETGFSDFPNMSLNTNEQTNSSFTSLEDEQLDEKEAKPDLRQIYYELREQRQIQPVLDNTLTEQKQDTSDVNSDKRSARFDIESFPITTNLPTREYRQIFGSTDDIVDTVNDLIEHGDQTVQSTVPEEQKEIVQDITSSTKSNAELDLRYSLLLDRMNALLQPLLDLSSTSFATETKSIPSNIEDSSWTNDTETPTNVNQTTATTQSISSNEEILISPVTNTQSIVNTQPSTELSLSKNSEEHTENTIGQQEITDHVKSLVNTAISSFTNIFPTSTPLETAVVEPEAQSSTVTDNKKQKADDHQQSSSTGLFELVKTILPTMLLPNTSTETSSENKHSEQQDKAENLADNSNLSSADANQETSLQASTTDEKESHGVFHFISSTISNIKETVSHLGSTDEKPLESIHTLDTLNDAEYSSENQDASTHQLSAADHQKEDKTQNKPSYQQLQIINDDYPWYSNHYSIRDAEAKFALLHKPSGLPNEQTPPVAKVEVQNGTKQNIEVQEDQDTDDTGFHTVQRRKRIPSSTTHEKTVPSTINTAKPSFSTDIDLQPVILYGNPSASIPVSSIVSQTTTDASSKKKQKKKKTDKKEMILFDAPEPAVNVEHSQTVKEERNPSLMTENEDLSKAQDDAEHSTEHQTHLSLASAPVPKTITTTKTEVPSPTVANEEKAILESNDEIQKVDNSQQSSSTGLFELVKTILPRALLPNTSTVTSLENNQSEQQDKEGNLVDNSNLSSTDDSQETSLQASTTDEKESHGVFHFITSTISNIKEAVSHLGSTDEKPLESIRTLDTLNDAEYSSENQDASTHQLSAADHQKEDETQNKPSYQQLQIINDDYPWYSNHYSIRDAEAKFALLHKPSGLSNEQTPPVAKVEVQNDTKQNIEVQEDQDTDDTGFHTVQRRKRIPSSTTHEKIVPSTINTAKPSFSTDIDLQPVILHGYSSAPVSVSPIVPQTTTDTSSKKKQKKKKKDKNEMFWFDAPEPTVNVTHSQTVENREISITDRMELSNKGDTSTTLISGDDDTLTSPAVNNEPIVSKSPEQNLTTAEDVQLESVENQTNLASSIYSEEHAVNVDEQPDIITPASVVETTSTNTTPAAESEVQLSTVEDKENDKFDNEKQASSTGLLEFVKNLLPTTLQPNTPLETSSQNPGDNFNVSSTNSKQETSLETSATDEKESHSVFDFITGTLSNIKETISHLGSTDEKPVESIHTLDTLNDAEYSSENQGTTTHQLSAADDQKEDETQSKPSYQQLQVINDDYPCYSNHYSIRDAEAKFALLHKSSSLSNEQTPPVAKVEVQNETKQNMEAQEERDKDDSDFHVVQRRKRIPSSTTHENTVQSTTTTAKPSFSTDIDLEPVILHGHPSASIPVSSITPQTTTDTSSKKKQKKKKKEKNEMFWFDAPEPTINVTHSQTVKEEQNSVVTTANEELKAVKESVTKTEDDEQRLTENQTNVSLASAPVTDTSTTTETEVQSPTVTEKVDNSQQSSSTGLFELVKNLLPSTLLPNTSMETSLENNQSEQQDRVENLVDNANLASADANQETSLQASTTDEKESHGVFDYIVSAIAKLGSSSEKPVSLTDNTEEWKDFDDVKEQQTHIGIIEETYHKTDENVVPAQEDEAQISRPEIPFNDSDTNQPLSIDQKQHDETEKKSSYQQLQVTNDEYPWYSSHFSIVDAEAKFARLYAQLNRSNEQSPHLTVEVENEPKQNIEVREEADIDDSDFRVVQRRKRIPSSTTHEKTVPSTTTTAKPSFSTDIDLEPVILHGHPSASIPVSSITPQTTTDTSSKKKQKKKKKEKNEMVLFDAPEPTTNLTHSQTVENREISVTDYMELSNKGDTSTTLISGDDDTLTSPAVNNEPIVSKSPEQKLTTAEDVRLESAADQTNLSSSIYSEEHAVNADEQQDIITPASVVETTSTNTTPAAGSEGQPSTVEDKENDTVDNEKQASSTGLLEFVKNLLPATLQPNTSIETSSQNPVDNFNLSSTDSKHETSLQPSTSNAKESHSVFDFITGTLSNIKETISHLGSTDEKPVESIGTLDALNDAEYSSENQGATTEPDRLSTTHQPSTIDQEQHDEIQSKPSHQQLQVINDNYPLYSNHYSIRDAEAKLAIIHKPSGLSIEQTPPVAKVEVQNETKQNMEAQEEQDTDDSVFHVVQRRKRIPSSTTDDKTVPSTTTTAKRILSTDIDLEPVILRGHPSASIPVSSIVSQTTTDTSSKKKPKKKKKDKKEMILFDAPEPTVNVTHSQTVQEEQDQENTATDGSATIHQTLKDEEEQVHSNPPVHSEDQKPETVTTPIVSNTDKQITGKENKLASSGSSPLLSTPVATLSKDVQMNTQRTEQAPREKKSITPTGAKTIQINVIPSPKDQEEEEDDADNDGFQLVRYRGRILSKTKSDQTSSSTSISNEIPIPDYEQKTPIPREHQSPPTPKKKRNKHKKQKKDVDSSRVAQEPTDQETILQSHVISPSVAEEAKVQTHSTVITTKIQSKPAVPSEDEEEDNEGFQVVTYRKRITSAPRFAKTPPSTKTRYERNVNRDVDHGRHGSTSLSIPRTTTINKTPPKQTSVFQTPPRSVSTGKQIITSAGGSNRFQTFTEHQQHIKDQKREPTVDLKPKLVQQSPKEPPTKQIVEAQQTPTKEEAVSSTSPNTSNAEAEKSTTTTTTSESVIPQVTTPQKKSKKSKTHKEEAPLLSTTTERNSIPLSVEETTDRKANDTIQQTPADSSSTSEPVPLINTATEAIASPIIEPVNQSNDAQSPLHSIPSIASSTIAVEETCKSSTDLPSQTGDHSVTDPTAIQGSAFNAEAEQVQTPSDKKAAKRRKKKLSTKDENILTSSTSTSNAVAPPPPSTTSSTASTDVNNKLDLFLPSYMRQQMDAPSPPITSLDSTQKKKSRSKMLTKDHEAKSLLTNEFDTNLHPEKPAVQQMTAPNDEYIDDDDEFIVQTNQSVNTSTEQTVDDILSRGFYLWLQESQAISQLQNNRTPIMQSIVIQPSTTTDDDDDDHSQHASKPISSTFTIGIQPHKQIHTTNAYFINHPDSISPPSWLIAQSNDNTFQDKPEQFDSDHADDSTPDKPKRQTNAQSNSTDFQPNKDYSRQHRSIHFDDWAHFLEDQTSYHIGHDLSTSLQCFYSQRFDDDTLISDVIPTKTNRARYGDFLPSNNPDRIIQKSKPSEYFRQSLSKQFSPNDDEILISHSHDGLSRQVEL